MKKIFVIIILLSLLTTNSAQSVTSTSEVEKHSSKDEYKVKTHLTGLAGIKFARIKFSIPENIEVAIPNDAKLQQTASSKFISYYIYAVGEDGSADFEFIVLEPKSTDEVSIGVHLQYSVGVDKSDVLFDPILIKTSKDYAQFSDDSGFKKVEAETKTDDNTLASNGSTSSGSTNNKTTNKAASTSNSFSAKKGTYSVQILSLADYNERRVKRFCKDHDLKFGDLIKREMNGATKVSIGRLSANSAQELKKRIIEENKVDGAFVVELK